MKNKSQRQLQVAEQIKRIVADIFLQDDHFVFPGLHLAVSQVDASPDIKNAKIFVNIFGATDPIKLIEKLNALTPYLRNRMAKKLILRQMPQLTFVLDETGKKADKLFTLLEQEKSKFEDQ